MIDTKVLLDRIWRRLRPVLLAGAALFVLFVVVDTLAPVDLEPRTAARVIVDSRGEPLRAFPDRNGEWRYQVSLEDLSPLYLQALIAYEDRWFYHHFGVNPLALVRASLSWALAARFPNWCSPARKAPAAVR